MRELIAKIEAATGPDRELDALILCALAAPTGSKVEQSKINGAWCIYEPSSGERFRLWERRDWWRADGWAVTASIDAAVVLAERVLRTYSLDITIDPSGNGASIHWWPNGLSGGDALGPFTAASVTPELAILTAILRAADEGAG